MLFNPWALEDAQETNLLIFWNGIYFSCFQLNHFLVPVFYPLFTDAPFVVPELFPLMGLMFVLFQARSFLLTKDKDEEGNECECQSHWNRRKSWGQTLSHETLHLQGGMWDNSEHAPMTHVKNDLLEPVCMGGGVIQHHPPTSQLWKQNFILTLRGGVEIGDNKASEGRNYSLVLIVGLQEGGWR